MTELKPVQVVNPVTGYGETKSVEVGLSPGQTSGTVGGVTVNRPTGTDVSKPYYPNQSADKQPTSQPSQISAPSGATNTPFEVKPFLDTHPLNPPSQTVQMGMIPDFGFASSLPKPAPVSGIQSSAQENKNITFKMSSPPAGVIRTYEAPAGTTLKSFWDIATGGKGIEAEQGKYYVRDVFGSVHEGSYAPRGNISKLGAQTLETAATISAITSPFLLSKMGAEEGIFTKGKNIFETGAKPSIRPVTTIDKPPTLKDMPTQEEIFGKPSPSASKSVLESMKESAQTTRSGEPVTWETKAEVKYTPPKSDSSPMWIEKYTAQKNAEAIDKALYFNQIKQYGLRLSQINPYQQIGKEPQLLLPAGKFETMTAPIDNTLAENWISSLAARAALPASKIKTQVDIKTAEQQKQETEPWFSVITQPQQKTIVEKITASIPRVKSPPEIYIPPSSSYPEITTPAPLPLISNPEKGTSWNPPVVTPPNFDIGKIPKGPQIPGLGGGGGPEKKRRFKYFRTFRASPIAAPSVTMSDVGKTMAKEMSKGMSIEHKKSRKRKK